MKSDFCHTFLNTSLYTTFFVILHNCSSSSKINILRQFLNVTRDTTTYNWSCVKTGRGKKKPTWDTDCPWLLFMVMAKHKVVGNWLLSNLNGYPGSERIKSILIIYILSPTCVPKIAVTPIWFSTNSLMNKRVSFHRPWSWYVFRSNITGAPTFKICLWFEIPEHFYIIQERWVHNIVIKKYEFPNTLYHLEHFYIISSQSNKKRWVHLKPDIIQKNQNCST